MGMENFRIALSYTIDELKDQVMNHLAVRELAQRPVDTAGPQGRCFVGDEAQDEFVSSHLRLNLWRVCCALSGWNATTDFNSENELCVELSLGYALSKGNCTCLGSAVRDWICYAAACEAAIVIFGDESSGRILGEYAEMAHQRVNMMLCASQMLMRAS